MKKKLPILIFLIFMIQTSGYAIENYALIIGIDDYLSRRITDLHYSQADASLLQDALIRFVRLKPANLHILLGEEATYANIKKEIYWLGEVAQQEDKVIFYFSGHGTRVEDKDGNEEDSLDEAFCPYETELDVPSTVILDDDIGHWFRRIQSKEIILIFDCCFSGGVAGRSLENVGAKGVDMAVQSTLGRKPQQEFDPYSNDLSIENKCIITASDADEQSYENPKLGHGIFTYYLGESIRGNADLNQDLKVTTGELYQYTSNKTSEFARTIQKKQTPKKFGTLDYATITKVNNQIADIVRFDKDLRIVWLNISGAAVRPGNKFVIRKNYQLHSRDLMVADKDIFIVQVTDVKEHITETKIIQEFFPGLVIQAQDYQEYYAEKLNAGSINVNTDPWSTVFLDGKEIGPTPLIINEVSEGDHVLDLKIIQAGYPGSTQKKVNVEANKTVFVTEKFIKR